MDGREREEERRKEGGSGRTLVRGVSPRIQNEEIVRLIKPALRRKQGETEVRKGDATEDTIPWFNNCAFSGGRGLAKTQPCERQTGHRERGAGERQRAVRTKSCRMSPNASASTEYDTLSLKTKRPSAAA